MSISWTALITILGMLCITYFTRLAGFFLLRNRKLSPKMARMMATLPACVLLSVIAPYFVSNQIHQLLALCITILCAWRLPMLPTVLIAVGSYALLGYVFQHF